jgi:prolyl 4-hydroxylase
MKLQCAPACFTCDLLSFETRCPMTVDDSMNAWSPGSLNAMFEQIATDPYYQQQYDIQVISRPNIAGAEELPKDDTSSNSSNDAPWVIVIDNFLTDAECETLIQLGAQEGYELSKDVGEQNFDGTFAAKESSGRTSTNAWCLTETCVDHPVTQSVVQKIENITGIPHIHYEYFQLLKYEETQFYGT